MKKNALFSVGRDTFGIVTGRNTSLTIRTMGRNPRSYCATRQAIPTKALVLKDDLALTKIPEDIHLALMAVRASHSRTRR